MSTKPELPVNPTGLLQNVQAMCLLYERDNVFSKSDVRRTLKTIYPWMPIEELAPDFAVPPPVLGEVPEDDYALLPVPDGSDDDLEVAA